MIAAVVGCLRQYLGWKNLILFRPTTACSSVVHITVCFFSHECCIDQSMHTLLVLKRVLFKKSILIITLTHILLVL